MDAFETAFPFVNRDDLELLRSHSRTVAFAQGDVLIAEGTRLHAMYVIASGAVSVEKDHLGGRVPLAQLAAGALVGEVSYLNGSTTTASVVALNDVEAHVLEDVDELLEAHLQLAAGVYRSLATLLAGRLRHTNEDRVVTVLQWG